MRSDNEQQAKQGSQGPQGRHLKDSFGRKWIIKSECPIVVKQKTGKRLSAYQRFLNAQLQPY